MSYVVSQICYGSRQLAYLRGVNDWTDNLSEAARYSEAEAKSQVAAYSPEYDVRMTKLRDRCTRRGDGTCSHEFACND